ncbi:hypothetical protein [uncultured Alistipes sp.]|uniref:hypothetical protein n=1 Tax=uncultured Alistipes sp. TaxID=538949 RepID=UPI0025EA5ACD|nr:hypothetical protein [uncultured Alistipes sp.]
MKKYIEYISQLANNKINKNFSNSDEDHALEVLIKIFQSSNKIIRIFAGSLCSDVPNDPRYIAALSDFIERAGQVRILLNDFNTESAKNSNLFKRLAYYTSLDNTDIQIHKTPAKPYLKKDPQKNPVHFTVGDANAYRVETDIEKRTANCNFNHPEGAENLIAFFDQIERSHAEKIDLNKCFAD